MQLCKCESCKLTCQILPDHYHKAWQPGDEISEYDLQLWSPRENSFFDLEAAMDHREKVKAVPKDKAKPRRNIRAPISVRTVRASSFQHLRVLDNICYNTLGEGLSQFAVPEMFLPTR